MAKSTKGKVKAQKQGKSSASRSNESKKVIRQLYAGSIPRPHMRVSGDMDTWRVSGMEIFNSINNSSTAISSVVNLNPSVAGVFPRLSALALQFQRYRFNSLRVHYTTGCPATRSGSLAIGISQEVLSLSAVPTDLADFAAFQNAAVGTVAGSFSAPRWVPETSETFYVDTTIGVSDFLKIYQGSLMLLTANALSSEAGLFAGYISLEYDITFYGFRPTQQIAVSWQAVSGQSVSTTLGTLLSISDNGFDDTSTVTQLACGRWPLMSLYQVIPDYSGASQNGQCQIMTDLPQGKQILFRLSVAFNAPTSVDVPPGLRQSSDYRYSERKTPSLLSHQQQSRREFDWEEVDDKHCDKVESRPKDPKLPATAGDYTISLIFFRPGDQTQINVYSATFNNPSSGSANVSVSTPVNNGYTAAAWSFAPVAGETRLLTNILPSVQVLYPTSLNPVAV